MASMNLEDLLKLEAVVALPNDVKNEIEKLINYFQEDTKKKRAEYEKYRVDSEQKYFELDKKLTDANSKLSSESKTAAELKGHLTELELKYQDSSNKLRVLEETRAESENNLQDVTRSRNQLQIEKEDLIEVLSKKKKEVDRLNTEWKELTDKLLEANNEKCEALARVEEQETLCVSSQHRESQLQREKNQVESMKTWLEKELERKSEELLQVKKEEAEKALKLQLQFTQLQDEAKYLQDTNESLRNTVKGHEESIEKYIERLKEARNIQTQLEEWSNVEMQAKDNLIILHKEASQEHEKKGDELMTAVEELQTLVQQGKDAVEEQQKLREKDLIDYRQQLSDKDDHITRLSQEVKRAQELVEIAQKKVQAAATQGLKSSLPADSIEALSPSAAAASRLLKSGMTLTQIYSEYVEVSEALHLEKEETKRLNQYLDQILQEIEEKAPIMRKQREDYERSLATISQLTQQLDRAMLECENSRVKADDSTRRFKQYLRENSRLKQETVDLGQQVRLLLKELEEARGTVVSTDIMYPDISSPQESGAAGVITQKLVSFRSIEELQEQNQRLLNVVRELGEKKEEEESEAVLEKTKEMKTQLEEALEEMQEMRARRERQQTMVESVVRQRDMYKLMLSQHGTSPVSFGSPGPEAFSQMSTPIATSSVPHLQSPNRIPDLEKELAQSKTTLEQLNDEFSTYKKEKAENEKILSTQIDNIKRDLSEVRISNAKASSQLEFSSERIKLLQSNAEGYKKEIKALREKNQQHTANLVKHEHTISIVTQDLNVSREAHVAATETASRLKADNELSKQTENRLMSEVERLSREKISQSLLMQNLKAIQNNLEMQKSENNQRYEGHIRSLEQTNESLTKRVEESKRELDTTVTRVQNEVQQSRENMKMVEQSYQKIQQEFNERQEYIQKLKEELSRNEEQLKAADLRIEKLTEKQKDIEIPEDTIKELEAQVKQKELQIKGLNEQVSNVKKHAENYKAMSDSIDGQLKQQIKTNQEYEDKTTQQIQDLSNEKSSMEKQIEFLQKEKTDLTQENLKKKEEHSNLTSTMQQKVSELEQRLSQAVQQKTQAESNEKVARSDCQTQVKLAQELQEKFTEEVALHSEDTGRLDAVTSQLNSLQDTLDRQRSEGATLKQKLNEADQTWKKQKQMLKDELQKTTESCSELQNQNKMLHEEMETLSKDMLALQGSALSEKGEELPKTEKSSTQILEIVKFLRSQKEILEEKVEVLQTENTKGVLKCETLEKQLQEANNTLAEKKHSAEVKAQADVMRKSENMDILTKTNKIMREEKDQLLNRLTNSEEQVAKLENDLSPLTDKNQELSAQIENLTSEKLAVEQEVKLWKTRSTQLVEQANRVDPEEYRRIVQEADSLKKEVTSLKDTKEKQQQELKHLANNVETRDKDLAEKGKTINQLRGIGRKYKGLSEEAQKEVQHSKAELETTKKELEEELQKKTKELDSTKQELQERLDVVSKNATEAQQKLQDAEKTKEEHFKKTNENKQEMNQRLLEAENKLAEMARQLGSVSVEKAEIDGKLKNETEKRQKVEEEINKFKEDITRLQTLEKKLKDENEDLEKKQTQSRNLLQTAKSRIAANKEQLDKLTEENKRMKDRIQTGGSTIQGQTEEEADLRMATLRSQYETKMAKLEKELSDGKETQATVGQLTKDKDELSARVNLLQKTIESLQKQKPVQQQTAKPRVSAAAIVDRTVPITTELPRTASIRPMASPSAQPHVSGQRPSPRVASAESRALASIRPMAMTSTSSATPTATVMPTTLSTQEDGATDGPSTAVARPRQQVQPMSPVLEQPSENEPEPGTSRDLPTQSQKRPRDEERQSSPPEEEVPEQKRTKIQEIEVAPIQQEVQEGENIETFQSSEEVVAQEEEPAPLSPVVIVNVSEEDKKMHSVPPAGDSDVMVILDEDDDDDDGIDVEHGYDDYGYQGTYDDGDDGENVVQITSQDTDDDSDVIVVYETEAPQSQTLTQTSTEPPQLSFATLASQATSTVPPHLPNLPRLHVPNRSERLPSVGRSHLAPFMIGGQTPYEDGDDGIVPSTPTLFVPRGNDGFAEAVSSPQVAHGGFFSGGDSSVTDFAQLASQGALGMDATRMDLSQLDEGRSVPNTPLTTTPPTISITEPQSHDSESQSLDLLNTGETQALIEGQSRTGSQPEGGEDLEETQGGRATDEAGDAGNTMRQQSEEFSKRDDTAQQGTSAASGEQREDQQEQGRRRLITPIVWDDPGTGSATTPATSTAQAAVPQVRPQTARRGQHGANRGPHMARSSRGGPRGNRGRGGPRGGMMNRPQQF